ncbi:transcriptional regulator [Pseudomonas ovata]|uniref:transcriptional regulator n=1 Tax=Pseudomonas ovata TaxID=1839709 RepID=UPI000D689932|nr:Cro/CI family transcriptional regulator [Pseudomonas ovata]
MKPAEAVREACRLLGSQAELARSLAVRTPTVSQWCSGSRPIPAPRALQIELLTQGQVKRSDLCPSFPWAEMVA